MAPAQRLQLITHSFDQQNDFEKRNYRYYAPERAGVPFSLCRVRYLAKNSPLAPHLHEGLYELVFMLKGEQIYQTQGESYCVRSGQLFFTPPDLIHSTGGNFEDKALYYYLQIHLEQLERCLTGGLSEEAARLADTIHRAAMGKRKVFPFAERVEKLLPELLRLHEGQAAGDHLRIFQRLLELLLLVCDAVSSPQTAETGRRPLSMGYAQRYIWEHVEEDLSVEALARLCSYSVSAFHAKFKQATGLPPHEYLLRQKIDRACMLLATGQFTVQQVSQRLSFCSEQYFTAVFKNICSSRRAPIAKSCCLRSKDWINRFSGWQ